MLVLLICCINDGKLVHFVDMKAYEVYVKNHQTELINFHTCSFICICIYIELVVIHVPKFEVARHLAI